MLMLLRKMFGKVHFKEIKYFSPDGKSMPNGIGFQRGGYLHKCKKNKEAFETDKSICTVHNAKRESLGGIIVFSTDAVADSLVCDCLQHITPPIAYSIGNTFRGQYVGSSGELYNKDSLTIVVNGMTTKKLLKLAEMLSKTLHPTGIIVKDMNTMKMYTANENKTE